MTTPALAQVDVPAGGWLRSLVPLGFATTIVGLTGAFIGPFMALFLNQVIRASPAQTSLFLFLSALAAVVVANAVGRVSDRPGARRWIMVAAAVCGLAGFTTYALVRNYWALLVTALTLVAVAGSLMPQLFALGREVLDRGHPARATMGVNVLRMMLSFSWAAGAPLAAFVLGLIDFTGLFIATAAAHVVILGIVTMLKAARGTGGGPRPGRDAVAAGAGGAAPARPVAAPQGGTSRAVLFGSALAFVVLQCVTTLTVTTMPLFVSVDLHASLSSAGLVLGLCAALEIPLMLVFGAFANRWPLRGLLLLGGGFGIAYCLAVSLAGRLWEVAVAQVLHACFVCAIGGLGISYFQQLLPTALGRATTMFTNAGRVSGMLTGLIFGVVEVHGYRLAYVTSLGLGILGTAILALTRRST